MPGADVNGWTSPWRGPSDERGAAWALLDALWQAPIAIAVLDRQLRIVRVNAAFARTAGVAAGDGRAAAEQMPGVWREDALARVVSSGAPLVGVVTRAEWPPGAGRLRAWRADYHPVRSESGEVLGVAAVLSDSTGAERDAESAREATADAEHAVQALMRLHATTMALSAAATTDEVARVVLEEGIGLLDAVAGSISRAIGPDELEILDAFGYPEKSLVAWRRYAADVPAPLADAFRTGQPVWIESGAAYAERYPHLAGAARAFPVGASAAVPLVIGGRVIGVLGVEFATPERFDPPDRSFIVAFAQECAQALERAHLYEAEERLRAQAERTAALLDTLFSSVPIGLAFADWNLRIVHANSAWARLHGAAPDACAGKRITDLLPGEGEERARGWRRVLASGEPALEIETRRGDPAAGGRAWLESWYPVVAGAQTIGLGIVTREITETKRANEFRKNVLGIVGHDLRNPLSAILGYARLLGLSPGLDERQARMVRGIDASARKSERIVSDLLDLTRIETARAIPVDPRPTRVDEICRAVVDEIAAAHPDHPVALVGRGDPAVEWDPDRAAQALSNLVGNAIRHGAPDRPVAVEWQADPDEVAIRVQNWGPAIPPERAARIFEAFQQGVAGHDRHAGLGLGLYIAREIVRAHGGTIEVRSSESDGTVFTLRLPRHPRRS